ncbi:S-formylglutathione hydrolase [Duganella qianjiadongensis]|uniref:S-formylglutathione hydrolase n=1 Tax=Duganella qianjiadongensis TaxID=2692176 RepID=A0ABW9VK94_9BURK|nr:S-formylglutathione hydrolase [Duganella qianjiadongensis]MYM39330.1 S-formylglutathione hydrolase [Duganella qianjiadongensis]
MLELLSEHVCFGGVQRFYRHTSQSTGLPMRFGLFLPPAAHQAGAQVPALFFLAGLTCSEETFMIKAGAQRVAAEVGMALITPDTSPRGAGIDGESAHWDFGVGAGFYLDASAQPWARHYRMESYIHELQQLLVKEFPIHPRRIGISGHSMGGHGALTLALRRPDIFRSVSAFAPIAAPSRCPWGIKAFSGYLGEDRKQWAAHDASLLMEQEQTPFPDGILIDQGLGDKFLAEQLYPQEFEAACINARQPLQLRRHAGYDHGYYFIASFIDDHIRFHARNLAS